MENVVCGYIIKEHMILTGKKRKKNAISYLRAVCSKVNNNNLCSPVEI